MRKSRNRIPFILLQLTFHVLQKEFVKSLSILSTIPDYTRCFTISFLKTNEPLHVISNNMVCATSKGSDQPAHARSLIRAFAGRLNTL